MNVFFIVNIRERLGMRGSPVAKGGVERPDPLANTCSPIRITAKFKKEQVQFLCNPFTAVPLLGVRNQRLSAARKEDQSSTTPHIDE